MAPDDDIRPPRWRLEIATQAILLVGMLAVMFPGVFLRGELASGADLLFQSPPWQAYAPPGHERPGNEVMPDIVTAMLPYYALTQQALARGEWPLWNPLEMAGMPLHANCQSATLYPPRLLHAFLDLHVATSLYCLLKLWLCGMTAFACARGLGLGLFAARFFSLAWAFNAYNFTWCYWPLPDVSAWLPVLFYGVEMAARGQARRAQHGIAAGGALLLLAGHPETAFTAALGAGVYFFARLSIAWPGRALVLRAIGACAAGWTLALLVTAALWLPFLEYLVNSYTLHERTGEDFGNYIAPIGLATLFVPRFVGTNAEGTFWAENTFNLHAYYPGMLAWAGAFIALTLLRDRVRRPVVGGLAIAALVCGLWAFAVPGTVLPFRLPGLHALRLNYHIVFAVFAVCLLGAHGLQHWIQRNGTRAGAAALAGGASVGVMVVWQGHAFFVALLRTMKMDAYVEAQILAAGALALFSAAALALCVSRRARRVAPAAVLIVFAADLAYTLRGLNPTVRHEHIFPRTALTDYLQGLPQPARVQFGAGYVASGLNVPYGVEDWLGYDGLYPDRVLRFMKALGPEIWIAAEPICAIGWYLHNPVIAARAAGSPFGKQEAPFPIDDGDYFERVAAHDGLEVYRNKRALPRAHVAGAVEALPSRKEIFAALKRPEFVPGSVVYTESPPPGAMPAQPGPAGTAKILAHTPTRVTIAVQAERAAALVLSDAFFPGWKATVNGVEAEIFPAHYAFRGVLVPAGESTVTFTYFPRSFQIGLAISCLTLLLAGLAGFVALRR